MANLKTVLKFIKDNQSISDAKALQEAISVNRSILNENYKNSFRTNDIVKINHKKVNPLDQFKVIKVNNKNLKLMNIKTQGIVTCSPSLVERIG